MGKTLLRRISIPARVRKWKRWKERLPKPEGRSWSWEINTLLLDTEAKKRKVTPQQLYEAEVARKLTQPTAAEIAKFIEENRDRIDQSDTAAIQTQVSDYLKGEREAQLSEELIKRLRTTNIVA